MKLNLSPKIFSLQFLFSKIELVIDIRPLSRILLCPIYRHSKEGWFEITCSARALAPSYPILLLKTLKNLRDLFLLKALESSLAPETPIWFLLRSKTSSMLLNGNTSASDLIPSFPKKFLDKFRTLMLLLKDALLGSNASWRRSANSFCSPFPESETLVIC